MTNPNDPAEFKRRLEEMPEGQRAQMLTLLQTISKPPESMLALFERVGLRWKREYIGKEGEYPMGAIIIDWREFQAAEKELQSQGPILKQLMADEFGKKATDQIQVNENGQVTQPAPPTEFKLLDGEDK